MLDRRTVAGGALVGFIFFMVMSCEMLSLKTVNSGTVSLLENLAIIIVPLLESAIHRRLPKAMSLLCAAVAVCGVALLTMEGGQFRPGNRRVHCPAVGLSLCRGHHHHRPHQPPGRQLHAGRAGGGLSGAVCPHRLLYL